MPRNASPSPTLAAETATKRQKIIDHLQTAQALADEIKDGQTAYFVELALEKMRADEWPKNNA